MEKRLFLAVTLSLLVMLLYPIILSKINPSLMTSEPHQNTQPIELQKDIETRLDSAIPIKEVNPSIVSIANDKYFFNISDIGGSINSINIKRQGFKDADLVSNANLQAGILSIEGDGVLSGLSSKRFEVTNIESGTRLMYNDNNIGIEKIITLLPDRYGATSSVTIKNNSGTRQDLAFEITVGSNISDKEQFESRYIAAYILYQDGKLRRVASHNSSKYNKLYQNNIEWLMLQNKYFSIIAKPYFPIKGVFTKSIQGRLVAGFIVNDNIMPAEVKSYNMLFYIGALDIEDLEKVDRSFGKAINFGVFTSIGLVLLGILEFFHGIFHNYGVAILLLTFCVGVVLYPLTFKSMKSMKRLQELQPQIEKLRIEHKNNPQRLNKEIMELYRRNNVNPMSGCLPLFLQMPIFIALYQTLTRSIRLKEASFLWIKDLSMPDAAFSLPINIPILGNKLNILPILMIGAMILQQRLSQSNVSNTLQTEQQKIMAVTMPLVFGFIFYNLPSGLVLYWLTNTILTIFLQYISIRKI